MTENKIREAVNWYKKEVSRTNVYEHCLRSLAEEYLKIEGWPKEKTTYCVEDKEYPSECKGFNEALRLCKLAHLKEKNKVS